MSEAKTTTKKIVDSIKEQSDHSLLHIILYTITTLTTLLAFKAIVSTNEYALVISLLISLVLITILFFKATSTNREIAKTVSEMRSILEEQENTVKSMFKIVPHVAGISTEYLTNIDNDDIDYAYQKSLEVIKNSEKSILIVGDYSPKTEVLDTTETRNEYLIAIEEKIVEKSKNRKSFKYLRIQQRDLSIFQAIKNKSGILDSNDYIAGDEQAFEHCKNILDKSPFYERVNVQIFVTPFIPSLPSILLVDDRHLLFTIPKKKDGIGLKTASVIHFIDTRADNPMINHFREIIKSITDDEEICRIRKIEDIFSKTKNEETSQNVIKESPRILVQENIKS